MEETRRYLFQLARYHRRYRNVRHCSFGKQNLRGFSFRQVKYFKLFMCPTVSGVNGIYSATYKARLLIFLVIIHIILGKFLYITSITIKSYGRGCCH